MEENRYNEYNNYNNELEKYNSYLNKIADLHIGDNLSESKRNWRGVKEIARKQALERGAFERSKILVGYKAVDSKFKVTLGSVRARDVQQAKDWLEAKGLRAEWVFELRAGESMEQFDDETGWLRHDYEGVKAYAALNCSLSQAEEFADQWLAEMMRKLNEKRDAAKDLAGVDPSKGYVTSFSPIATKLLAKSQLPNQLSGSRITARTVVATAAGLVIDAALNFKLGVPEPMFASVLLGTFTLFGQGVARSNFKSMEPSRQRVINSSLDLERASLRSWLQVRYGISVSEDMLLVLVDAVHGNVNQVGFEAEDGRYFKFMKVADAEGWFVFETAAPVGSLDKAQAALTRASASLSRAQTILEPKALPPVFMGEVTLLHERIQQMLGLLSQQSLNVEEQHVVNRVQQDVETTASTLASLAALGDREAGQKRAAVVLGQLVEELNDLVAGKKAVLLGDLQVQGSYVKERRRAAGSIGIELVKPAIQAITEEEASR